MHLLYLLLYALLSLNSVNAGIWLWVQDEIKQCDRTGHPFGTDGTGPYFGSVMNGDTDTVIQNWPAQTSTDQIIWIADLPAGASISFKFWDSSGQTAYGYPRTIQVRWNFGKGLDVT